MRNLLIGGLLLVLLSCTSKDKEIEKLNARLADMEQMMIENNRAEEVKNAFDPAAKIGFEQQTITIDEATVGEAITVDYVIKSEGTTPLIIHNVNTPCGCTVPDWTQTPIQPGETGKIKIKYTPKVSDKTNEGGPGVRKRANLITNAGNVFINLQVEKVK